MLTLQVYLVLNCAYFGINNEVVRLVNAGVRRGGVGRLQPRFTCRFPRSALSVFSFLPLISVYYLCNWLRKLSSVDRIFALKLHLSVSNSRSLTQQKTGFPNSLTLPRCWQTFGNEFRHTVVPGGKVLKG